MIPITQLWDTSKYSYGIIVSPCLLESAVYCIDQLIVKGQKIPCTIERTYFADPLCNQMRFILIQNTSTASSVRLDNSNEVKELPQGDHFTLVKLEEQLRQIPVIDMDFGDSEHLRSGNCVKLKLTIDVCGTVTLRVELENMNLVKEAYYDSEEDEYPSVGIGIHSVGDCDDSLTCLNIRKKNDAFPVEKTFTFYAPKDGSPFIKLPIYISESKQEAYPVAQTQKPLFTPYIPLPTRIVAGSAIQLIFQLSDDGDLRICSKVDSHDPVTVIYHQVLKKKEPLHEIELSLAHSIPLQSSPKLSMIIDRKTRILLPEDRTECASIYGIDFGAAYSCIARINPASRQPEIIVDLDDDSETVASAVYFDNGGTYVGEAAKEAGASDPKHLYQFFKQDIGRPDVAQTHKDDFDGPYFLSTPVELLSIVFAHLVKNAKKAGVEDVKTVIVTCPAYFDSSQREAIKQAGEVAGFNVIRIVNEPIAAVMSYCYDKQFAPNANILVYDLGGETFDVSIVHVGEEDGGFVTEIRGIDGDNHLGGKNWDAKLYQIVRAKLEDENGLDIEDESDIDLDLRYKTENAKINLSKAKGVAKVVTYDGDRLTITREEFEKATADLVSRTLEYVDRVLVENNLTSDNIDKVLLVGGSSKMPMIQAAVKDKFGQDKVILHEPSVSIAKGAAVFMHITSDRNMP